MSGAPFCPVPSGQSRWAWGETQLFLDFFLYGVSTGVLAGHHPVHCNNNIRCMPSNHPNLKDFKHSPLIWRIGMETECVKGKIHLLWVKSWDLCLCFWRTPHLPAQAPPIHPGKMGLTKPACWRKTPPAARHPLPPREVPLLWNPKKWAW